MKNFICSAMLGTRSKVLWDALISVPWYVIEIINAN